MAVDDIVNYWNELEEARHTVDEADGFYDGNAGEVYASPRVRELLRRSGVEQIEEFNYCAVPVDTIAERLRVSAVHVLDGSSGMSEDEAEPPAGEKKTDVEQAQQALDRLRRRNQMDAEEPALWLQVSKHGDAYMLVWPVTDDAGKVTDVDMRVHGADTMLMVYADEDQLMASHVLHSWTVDEPDADGKSSHRVRCNIYYDGVIERYITIKGSKAYKTAATWERYGASKDNPDGWRTVHEYGMPIFHYRNGRPYGTPEHRRAYGPQQMLTKLVQALAVGIDFQSFPQRYLLMDPKSDQPMGNLLDPEHPETGDDPEDETSSSQLSGDPSAVWRLYGATQAGQFPATSPDVWLSPFDRFVRAMGELCGIPLYRFGSSFASPPSGAALRIINGPLDSKTRSRQTLYGEPHADAHELALRMLGHDVEVDVAWSPFEYATSTEDWQVVAAKVAAGIPRRVALMEAGYTAAQVEEWMNTDTGRNEQLRSQIGVLQEIAGAAQQLGAAVTMGVMSKDQVTQVMDKLVPQQQAPAEGG